MAPVSKKKPTFLSPAADLIFAAQSPIRSGRPIPRPNPRAGYYVGGACDLSSQSHLLPMNVIIQVPCTDVACSTFGGE